MLTIKFKSLSYQGSSMLFDVFPSQSVPSVFFAIKYAKVGLQTQRV
jgi:hypothetical protein